MSYDYQIERENLLTDEGQKKFLRVRDHVNGLLDSAGALMMIRAIDVVSGDGWEAMACIDRMVELKELEEVGAPAQCGQARVFARPHDRLHPRFR